MRITHNEVVLTDSPSFVKWVSERRNRKPFRIKDTLYGKRLTLRKWFFLRKWIATVWDNETIEIFESAPKYIDMIRDIVIRFEHLYPDQDPVTISIRKTRYLTREEKVAKKMAKRMGVEDA